jgi:hypothetical protein
VALALAAFVCAYFMGTSKSRAMMRQPQPELAWLQQEFGLSSQDLKRISALHEEYLPHCAERCRAIEAQNQKLAQLLTEPEKNLTAIEQVVTERARVRAECEIEMLRHFLEVSRTMPPEQGRRYLNWVQQQSSLRAEGMEQRHQTEGGHHH